MKMKLIALVAVACAAFAATMAARSHAASQVGGLDETYLKTSAQGDMFEITGGKLALEKSHNKSVRALAQRLIKDHTKSLSDARQLAQKLGVTLESKPTPSMQWELKAVAKFHTFNHWYSSLEVLDHQQDIQETTDEIQMGSNAEVKNMAAQELPTLKMHLKLAQIALKAAK